MTRVPGAIPGRIPGQSPGRITRASARVLRYFEKQELRIKFWFVCVVFCSERREPRLAQAHVAPAWRGRGVGAL